MTPAEAFSGLTSSAPAAGGPSHQTVLLSALAIAAAGLSVGLRDGAPSALAAPGSQQNQSTALEHVPQYAPAALQPPFMPDTPGPDKPAIPPSPGGIPFPKSLDDSPVCAITAMARTSAWPTFTTR